MSTPADSTGESHGLNDKQVRQCDAERQYLEGLLNNRLNFYMVFASLLIVGLFGSDAITTSQRVVGLAFGAAVSTVLGLAVWRTHLLIEHILDQLNTAAWHPYAVARREVNCSRFRILRVNANVTFALIPSILAVLFVILAGLAAW